MSFIMPGELQRFGGNHLQETSAPDKTLREQSAFVTLRALYPPGGSSNGLL
jgi:hypothetical protein